MLMCEKICSTSPTRLSSLQVNPFSARLRDTDSFSS
jgi:hypothetical protein